MTWTICISMLNSAEKRSDKYVYIILSWPPQCVFKWYLFIPPSTDLQWIYTKHRCLFICRDTEHQWEPRKVCAPCSWGFQSVHIKKVSVVACAFTASQWKLTVAKGTNFILLLEEDMKTSLLKLMDLVYRADEGWIKKKKFNTLLTRLWGNLPRKVFSFFFFHILRLINSNSVWPSELISNILTGVPKRAVVMGSLG